MMLKRTFDLLVSSTALLLIIPLLALLAIWVKLDSPGPVLFKQQRVGRGGRQFVIHKLRTMTIDSERINSQITVAGDSRITRSGRLLRKYKLDELPQLVDVIVGNMSMVGPRPEVPRYMELYPAQTREKVLSVRPGITDWASLRFRDENEMLASASNSEQTYIAEVLPIKQRLYLYYVDNRSFWMDLRILGQTFWAIVSRR